MLWLVVFLVVAVTIQARQSAAIATARRLGQLRNEREALEAQKAAIERGIRVATSRRELGARAEAELGLHFPHDSEFVVFPLTRPR